MAEDKPMAEHSSDRRSPRAQRLTAIIVIAVLVIAAVLVFATGLHRELSFATLIRHRAAIDTFVTEHRFAAFASFVVLYIAVVALSIPGAFILTVSGGLIFGAVFGGIAAFVGALVGASIIFLIARTALGGWLVKRAGPFAERLANGFRRDAFNYLLFLRLVPAFPFWLVNIVPALVGVQLSTFIAATALGIFPLTFAIAFFGSGLDSTIADQTAAYQACLAAGRADCRPRFELSSVLTPQLIAALVVLGIAVLMPVAIRKWKAAHKRKPEPDV
ncbi:MAG: TVP38/TMEM64 family protein [Xanthobacteraceae bacterium]